MASSDRQGGWRLADELVEAARVGTAFADLLLQRARELLSPELTEAQYAGLGGQDEPRVRDLGRSRIEKALRERGGPVVTGLGLDPRAFRLACIPVDVFTRLGARRGWGTREQWTHFDGYMATKERKLLALVGGDVRFGGLHDLVAVGADYDSERLVARFAIVRRRRFATW